MKQMAAIFLLLLFLSASGQENADSVLFQTQGKMRPHYVDLRGTGGKVYSMGRYLDKAGSGYSIAATDTLIIHEDGSYSGNKTKVVKENNKLYLIITGKKTSKFLLNTVKDPDLSNYNLNNAYYLDHYFKMCEELNKLYPLNHNSFRNGFWMWKEIPNKNMDYLVFRNFADKRLKEIKDSISEVQNRYVRLTNYITGNLQTPDYHLLKDSLTKLPAEYKSSSWYYGTVVNEIAKQRPEYFFRLAEDFPDNQNLIFGSIENSKQVIQGLKAVEGYGDAKKAFFKDRRFGRTMPYKIIATYAIVGGLIALLIASK
jgi:hypothetical protein